jgi:DNA-binding IclR family transcriptional regulator
MLEAVYSHVVESAMQTDKSVIKSAHRVLQVFEFFADARKPASATEIATALGFPQSSTSMLLRSLVALGYLDYHREVRTFEPTIRLSLLGGWIPERIDVASNIIEILNKLHEDTGETVVLGEQYRNFVRYIYVVQRPAAGIFYYIKAGTLRPICTTANGRMLLTLNTDQEVLSIVHRANAEQDDSTQLINRAELLADLAVCREEGFSQTHKVTPDWVAMQCAVLLPEEHAGRRLSVGIFSEKSRFEPRAEFFRERMMKIACA